MKRGREADLGNEVTLATSFQEKRATIVIRRGTTCSMANLCTLETYDKIHYTFALSAMSPDFSKEGLVEQFEKQNGRLPRDSYELSLFYYITMAHVVFDSSAIDTDALSLANIEDCLPMCDAIFKAHVKIALLEKKNKKLEAEVALLKKGGNEESDD